LIILNGVIIPKPALMQHQEPAKQHPQIVVISQAHRLCKFLKYI